MLAGTSHGRTGFTHKKARLLPPFALPLARALPPPHTPCASSAPNEGHSARAEE